MKTLYVILGVGLLAGYAVAGAMGLEIGGAERVTVPAEVRKSPGGYRSFHFWHSGSHWGK